MPLVRESTVVVFLLVIASLLYLVPSVIAYSRHHRKRTLILMLNLLTGWTAIGWVISAVWSATPDVEASNSKPIRAQESLPLMTVQDISCHSLQTGTDHQVPHSAPGMVQIGDRVSKAS